MRAIIVYNTQTGTTQYVAEILQSKLQEFGHQVDLHSVREQGSDLDFSSYQMVILASPTYDDGKLEQGMRVFITKCKADLSPLKMAVVGLGNTSYPQFCTAATILEEWVIQQKGHVQIPTLRIDGFPDDVTPIQDWVVELDKSTK